ncbi:mitochondrial inner membrane protease subunit 1 isoform X1 [Musca domestica]|uniref:Mitochondrial inner membrane protease subunit n=1 Tax=Musca domestica TaxID=7370 RepID=A0A1I8MSV8_MUSDO|nr:mitochondrial inner membrane protease subunit 1 isoform X1 [Musca domestica]
MKVISHLKDIVKYSIQYMCVTHCFFEYVGDFVVCNGPSMEPTLFSNNILLTERITTRFYKPNRGDIVIAVSPTNPDQYICKRVIGLPGDKIITEKLTENKEDETLSKTVDKYTPTFNDEYVPKGFVWIEGDNSTNSSDSRYYGPIPLGLIRSRAICRIWPLNEIKTL